MTLGERVAYFSPLNFNVTCISRTFYYIRASGRGLSSAVIIFVAACNAEIYRLLYVFVGHASNKIDEVSQQISRTEGAGTGGNFAGS